MKKRKKSKYLEALEDWCDEMYGRSLTDEERNQAKEEIENCLEVMELVEAQGPLEYPDDTICINITINGQDMNLCISPDESEVKEK